VAESIRIQEVVSYPFREPGWPGKAGLIALLSFIPVVNFAVVGYEVEIARRVASGASSLLPDWSDLGGHFQRGLWLALARTIYLAPILVLMALAFVAGGATLFTIDTQYEAWSPVFGLVCGGGILLGILFGLIVSVVNPAVTVRYLEVGTFASCFDFPTIWRHMRQHPVAHLSVFGWTLVLSLGMSVVVGPASVVLGFIPCLGTLAYPVLIAAMAGALILFRAHLEGQLFQIVQGSTGPVST
jgi:hypothetical protein